MLYSSEHFDCQPGRVAPAAHFATAWQPDLPAGQIKVH